MNPPKSDKHENVHEGNDQHTSELKQQIKDLQRELERAIRGHDQYQGLANTIGKKEEEIFALQHERENAEKCLRGVQKDMIAVKTALEDRIEVCETEISAGQSRAIRMKDSYEKEIQTWKKKLQQSDDDLKAEVEALKVANHQITSLKSQNIQHLPGSSVNQPVQPGQKWVSRQDFDAYVTWAGGQMDKHKRHISDLEGELTAEKLAKQADKQAYQRDKATIREQSQLVPEGQNSPEPKAEEAAEAPLEKPGVAETGVDGGPQEGGKKKRRTRRGGRQRRPEAVALNLEAEEELGSQLGSVGGPEVAVSSETIAYSSVKTQTDFVPAQAQVAVQTEPNYSSAAIQAEAEYVSTAVQADTTPLASESGFYADLKTWVDHALTRKLRVVLTFLFLLLTLSVLIWSLRTQIQATRERRMWLDANDVSRRSAIYLTNVSGVGKRVGWIWEERLMRLEAEAGRWPKKFGPEY